MNSFPLEHVSDSFTPYLVFRAKLLTLDPLQPTAEAFCVRDGRFTAVGSNADILLALEDDMQVFNARGRVIVPGFIDAHMHPDPTYSPESPCCVLDLGPDQVKSMDELIAQLRDKAEQTPEGGWIRGFRYNDRVLGRHPTREDLDKASTGHPILLTHSSYHVFAVNGYALAQAGMDREAVDPEGGGFDRDADGRPNGVLREPVTRDRVLQGNRPFPTPDPEEELEAYRRTFDRFAARGITSVADAAYEPDKFEVFRRVAEDELPIRVTCMFREEELETKTARGERTGDGDDFLKVGAMKIFHGNSLTGHTCWLSEPYADRDDYFGIPPERSQQELNDLIQRAHRAGFQIAVHANGDREIAMVVDAFDHVLRHYPRKDHRHRIEHASVMTAPLLKRIRELGLVLAPHSYIYEFGEAMEPYGEDRYPWLHPNRKAVDAGIAVAGNSDYPISAADPLLRMKSLCTRTSAAGKVVGADEVLTVSDALKAFTLGAAYAQFEEDRKGSITPGKLADFTVLSADPLQTDPFELDAIEVLGTFVGGHQIFPQTSSNPLDVISK